MAVLSDIVFDSLHPARLARFWATALEGYDLRPYDGDEIARLAALGLDPESDPSVAVDGPGPTLFFQAVHQPKKSRNRVHLDARAQDRTAECARLVEHGARVRDVHDTFTVMLDPEGNEFCVVDP